MTATTIVAIGGGGLSQTQHSHRLHEFLLSLAPPARRPRICFVPTASGDSADLVKRFKSAFPKADTSVLSLFWRDRSDLRAQVLAQDIIYVGGGSTANLLAIWRLHGLDEVLTEAARAGVVMAGWSAGMNCWFEASVTDSFGPGLAPLDDGLGLLHGSCCPHYHGKEHRRPRYLDLVASGEIAAGYAVDDNCALVFKDGELAEAVSSRKGAGAFRVLADSGTATEQPLDVRFLGGPRILAPGWLRLPRLPSR